MDVELVFRLVKGHALRTFEDLVRDLFVAMGRQAMEDDGVGLGLGQLRG